MVLPYAIVTLWKVRITPLLTLNFPNIFTNYFVLERSRSQEQEKEGRLSAALNEEISI